MIEETTKFTDANSEYSDSRAFQISYDSVETITGGTITTAPLTATSGTIQYYYLDAAVGCDVYKDIKKCQLLANLCVLQLYDSQTEVCKLYKDIVKELPDELPYPEYYPDPGFKMSMPWLYYEEQPRGAIASKAKRVQFRASFEYQNLSIGIVNKLGFVLAKYDLEGNFYGFEELYDQLSICKQPSDDQNDVFRIGVTLRYLCKFDLNQLISSNKFERPLNENMFFELYLKDYDGSLIDVPILIDNVGSEEGGYPNKVTDTEF